MKNMFLFAAVFLIFSSCSDFKDSVVGTLGEKCYGNNACKEGLICQNGKCVNPDEAQNDDDADGKDYTDFGDTGDTGTDNDEMDDMDVGDTGNTGNTGDVDEISDADADVFDICSPNPCTGIENSDGICLSDTDTYSCGCDEGYEWNGTASTCVGIPDPCLNDPCVSSKPNSTCVSEKASGGELFTGNKACACNFGWVDNEAENECIMAWQSVSAGKDHTCGISQNGILYCWGSNFNGQLGNDESGESKEKLIPFKISSFSWISVSAGEAHTCGTDASDDLYCWGHNYYGQVGNGSSGDTPDILTPVLIGATDFSLLSTGRNHTCSIDNGGGLYCWGWNLEGQIGNNSKVDVHTPLNIQSTMNWDSVSSGNAHTCGITSENDLYCWGINYRGQLGDSTNDSALEPLLIGSDKWSDLSCGSEHSCGIKDGGNLYCWGMNTVGQLGDDSQTGRNSPVKVGMLEWKKISAGKDHTCAINTDDDLFCWGNNFHGALGLGLGVGDYFVPYQVMGSWIEISAGDGFTCGIKESGALYCWGANEFGQVGVGTSSNTYNSPQAVESFDDGS